MSYFFDAANETLKATLATSIDAPVTLAAWVLIPTWRITFHHRVIQIGANVSSNNGSVGIAEGDVTGRMRSRPFNSAGTANNAAQDSGTQNAWYPVVVTATQNGANTVGTCTIYNGAFANSATHGTLDYAMGGNFAYLSCGDTLGGDEDWASSTYTRYIAEVAVWRKVLTQSEIESYIAATSADQIAASDLVGYWSLASDLTQTDGIQTIGNLTVSGATYNASHPTISGGLAKKLKILVHPDAASASGVEGIVWNASAGIAGTELGEFTGETFEVATEGTGDAERAVLLVPVADFGGGALAVNDVVPCLVRNATYTTGLISGTVIEE